MSDDAARRSATRVGPNFSSAPVLNGWKEIAAHLGKSPRTALRWEHQLGMPVHRMPGRHADIVYAFPHELDAWRRQRESGPPAPREPEPAAPPPPAQRASPSQPWHRSRPLVLATVAIASVVVLLGAAMRIASPGARSHAAPVSVSSREPASWRVRQDALDVLDAAGTVIWSHLFDFRLDASSYAAARGPFVQPALVRIVDLEGDGAREVLFVSQTVERPEANRLYCFESDGRVRFVHAPRAAVRFGGDQYGPPFGIKRLIVTPNPDRSSSIWIAASHRQWFPTVVQKLDAAGRVQGEYWTNGHVTALQEAEIGGRRLMLVGGTANERYEASLAAIDYDRPGGRAPAASEQYRCTSCPQIDPLQFFLFPRTDVARESSSRPFVVEMQRQPDGGLWVTVLQDVLNVPGVHAPLFATTHYRFDWDLRLTGAEVGDQYRRAHVLLERQGRLTHRFGAREVRELLSVHRWSGVSFAAANLSDGGSPWDAVIGDAGSASSGERDN